MRWGGGSSSETGHPGCGSKNGHGVTLALELPAVSCVASGRMYTFSGPQFAYLYNRRGFERMQQAEVMLKSLVLCRVT